MDSQESFPNGGLKDAGAETMLVMVYYVASRLLLLCSQVVFMATLRNHDHY